RVARGQRRAGQRRVPGSPVGSHAGRLPDGVPPRGDAPDAHRAGAAAALHGAKRRLPARAPREHGERRRGGRRDPRRLPRGPQATYRRSLGAASLRLDMGELVLQGLREAGTNFLAATADMVPRTVITVSMVLTGWLIAAVLRRVVRVVLTRVGFKR